MVGFVLFVLRTKGKKTENLNKQNCLRRSNTLNCSLIKWKMPLKTTNKEQKQRTNAEDKTFTSRRAAFRTAKRDMKIPMQKQPDIVLSNSQSGWEATKMDSRNNRLYIFRIIKLIFGKKELDEIHFREDKAVTYSNDEGNQLDHFNIGRPPNKLKSHYFFKKRKR